MAKATGSTERTRAEIRGFASAGALEEGVSSKTAPACRGAAIWTVCHRSAAALCAAIVWAAIIAITLPASASELERRTAPTPAFVLPSLDYVDLSLETLRGRAVIVHFFATWCEPCREELPSLQRLATRLDGKPVTVIAISVAEVPPRVRRFLQSTSVAFPVLLDQDRAVARAWNISALPSTVILGVDLKPRLGVESDYDWDRVDAGALIETLKQSEEPEAIQKGGST